MSLDETWRWKSLAEEIAAFEADGQRMPRPGDADLSGGPGWIVIPAEIFLAWSRVHHAPLGGWTAPDIVGFKAEYAEAEARQRERLGYEDVALTELHEEALRLLSKQAGGIELFPEIDTQEGGDHG